MRYELLGVKIDDLAPQEIDKKIEDWLSGVASRVIVTPNAEFLLDARRNSGFMDLLNKADLAVVDSVSLQYAAAALSDWRLVNRIPGVDLLDRICGTAAHHHARVLLLGGEQGVAEASAQRLRQRYEALDIVAFDPGRILWQEKRLMIDDCFVEEINALAPAIVAVGLGQYKQEQLIEQVRGQCPSVRIWIGVGGALDMISGFKRRAPGWMSRVGLEWLWRLWIEPCRAHRIANAVIVFPLIIAREALHRGTLLRSIKQVFSEIYRHWSI